MSDKSKWPKGPWHHEPDTKMWVDVPTGLACVMRRNWSMGFWLGYVAVPSDHPWSGLQYTHSALDNIDVHGGLTFSGYLGPPRTDWVLGFDAGHALDLAPGMAGVVPFEYSKEYMETLTYRDEAYMTAEVKKLAHQIHDARAPVENLLLEVITVSVAE